MTEILSNLITSAGLGLGAGVNAYATFLVFGLLGRFYPSLFDSDLASFFASTPVLVGMAVLYTIEFFADKIPTLDHVWDAVHTFVRPLAGAAVAFASVSAEMPKQVLWLAAIVGGGAALSGHLTKASVRAVSTATTGGAANPILSVIEDVVVVIQSILAIFLPIVFLIVLGVVLIPAVLLAMRFFSKRQRAQT